MGINSGRLVEWLDVVTVRFKRLEVEPPWLLYESSFGHKQAANILTPFAAHQFIRPVMQSLFCK
jgi:hypothetical protein